VLAGYRRRQVDVAVSRCPVDAMKRFDEREVLCEGGL
jgi:hypothetical protein